MPSSERSTMVVFEPASGRKLVCNPARAARRFVPASTYKVPHTLIALETGTVADINHVFSWDKRDRGVAAWNRDLTLGQAVAASAVWVFQDVATSLGHAGEAEWVKKLGYGNAHVGEASELRHFWLSGPLAISAEEQVDFLVRLRTSKLPVSESAVSATVAALRTAETAEGFPVYAKTGAMLAIDDEGFLRNDAAGLLPSNRERTGWFVGWIERPQDSGGPVYFAINLDLALPDAMNQRIAAAYDLLAANGFEVPNRL